MVRGAAGAALFALFLGDLLSPSTFLARRDAFRLYLPLEGFLADALRRGALPTWFPFDGAGVSFLGTAVGAPLDPLKVLALLMPPDQSLKWEALVLLAVAGVGAWCFARRLGASEPLRWLATVAYAGSGYLLSTTETPIYLHAAALLPWLALAAMALAERPAGRPAAGLAAMLALTALGGDLQGAMLQALLAGAYVLASPGAPWRRLAWLALAGALAAALVAPAAGAILVTAAESGRAAGLGLAEATSWSLHPVRLLELLVGPMSPPGLLEKQGGELARFLGGGGQGYLWASSELVGLAVVWLALCGLFARKRSRALTFHLALAGVALLLALGSFGKLYVLAYEALPFWRSFRYPEKLMPFALLGLVGAAAASEKVVGERRGLAGGILLGLTATLLAAWAAASSEGVGRLLAWLAPGPPASPELVDALALAIQTRALAALLVAVVMGAVLRFWPQRWAWAALALSVGYAWWADEGLVPGRDRELVELQPTLLGPLREHLGAAPGRLRSMPESFSFPHGGELGAVNAALLGDLQSLDPDQAARFGLGNISSYLPGMKRELVEACGDAPPCASPCARRLGARFCVAAPEEQPNLRAHPELKLLAEATSPRLALLEDPRARPLVSLPRLRGARDGHEAQLRFANDDPWPEDVAWQVGLGTEREPAVGQVRSSRSRPDEIEVELQLDRGGPVLVAEQCSPGWRATLDGQPVPLAIADLAFCTLNAPAGGHRVVLRYVPPGWPWVWAIFSLGLGATVLLALRRPKAV
ncbi:MAG: hypothetical protein JST54_15845 [Deltaproteobacteria bacterium]|nr:hypothetical protein [Deltaproteobacteria bacterium]